MKYKNQNKQSLKEDKLTKSNKSHKDTMLT